MHLKDYLATGDALAISALAQDLKVSRQAVYNMQNGATPSLKRALRIEELTGGAVTPYDWGTPEEEKKRKEKQSKEDLDALL